MTPADDKAWFNETLYPDVAQRFTVDRVIFRERTEHQDLVIFENKVLGRILALDGVIQTAEGDEFVYHEMLTHVPILAHGKAKRVLIVGGGDGGMAREAMKHPGVERVTMVEIDRGVVDLCATHIPSIGAAAFKNPKLDLVIADGAAFVKACRDRFDVIIIDSTDPVGPAAGLFSEAFYKNCFRALRPNGVVVGQSESPLFHAELILSVQKSFKAAGFRDVATLFFPQCTYPSGWWSATMAGKDMALANFRAQDAATKTFATRYYNRDIHAAALASPEFLRTR